MGCAGGPLLGLCVNVKCGSRVRHDGEVAHLRTPSQSIGSHRLTRKPRSLASDHVNSCDNLALSPQPRNGSARRSGALRGTTPASRLTRYTSPSASPLRSLRPAPSSKPTCHCAAPDAHPSSSSMPSGRLRTARPCTYGQEQLSCLPPRPHLRSTATSATTPCSSRAVRPLTSPPTPTS